ALLTEFLPTPAHLLPGGVHFVWRGRGFQSMHSHGGMRPRSISASRANAPGRRGKRKLRSAAASSLNWPAYGWRQPLTRRPLSVSDLHLLACLVLPRNPGGVLLRASSPSIAARIDSRAMSNSF